MIDLEPHPEGTVLPVRVHAGSRRNEARLTDDGLLRVDVTQAPEKGKANQAIVALLAKQFSLRKSQLELISGSTSRQKRFLVRGITPKDLADKIQKKLKPDPD